MGKKGKKDKKGRRSDAMKPPITIRNNYGGQEVQPAAATRHDKLTLLVWGVSKGQQNRSSAYDHHVILSL